MHRQGAGDGGAVRVERSLSPSPGADDHAGGEGVGVESRVHPAPRPWIGRTGAQGHRSLTRADKATIWRILRAGQIKPHKVPYYLERRAAQCEEKVREVLMVYQEVNLQNAARASAEDAGGAGLRGSRLATGLGGHGGVLDFVFFNFPRRGQTVPQSGS